MHRPRTASSVAHAAVAGLIAVTIPVTGWAADPTPGAPDIGDPYSPGAGNGGYDVTHYDVDVRYALRTGRLSGTTRIEATATQDLSAFNLDLALRPTEATVNGESAQLSQAGTEVTITPRAPLVEGAEFEVTVTYAGRPDRLNQASVGGWHKTRDGAVVAGEPEAATAWFPSNDHPSDKATMDVVVRTGPRKQVIGNGRLVSRQVGRLSRWHGREGSPIATYRAMLAIGDFRVRRSRTASGTRVLTAVSTRLRDDVRRTATRSMAFIGRITDLLQRRLGPYPFQRTGGAVVASGLGFPGIALATQTRPVYSWQLFSQGDPGACSDVMAALLASQWFGNSVGISRWQDLWLSDGLSEWAAWAWTARRLDWSEQGIFQVLYQGTHSDEENFWGYPVADPGDYLYLTDLRGAMTMQALRNVVGAATHRRIVRTWVSDHAHGTATTAEFEALAERISGRDLDEFFDVWLHQAGKPPADPRFGIPTDWAESTATDTASPRQRAWLEQRLSRPAG